MAWRGSKYLDHPGPRHAPDWYDQSEESTVLEAGDRMLVRCQGGPCTSRLEMYPPRLEIAEPDGLYVLSDEGPRDRWFYEFVPTPV
jgi:hypothetical protein